MPSVCNIVWPRYFRWYVTGFHKVAASVFRCRASEYMETPFPSPSMLIGA